MKAPLLIAITTGDQDGVGLEVAAKALRSLGPKTQAQFILFRSMKAESRELRWIDQKFQRKTYHDVHTALNAPLSSRNQIYDIASPLPPPFWVEIASKLALTKRIHALVSGPLSKTSFVQAGLKDMGHTGLLRRVTGKDDLFMGFLGDKFSVVLATDHIPLNQVPSRLNATLLKKAALSGLDLLPLLRKSQRSKPIGLLGLNPHSGEGGLLGGEEASAHSKVLATLESRLKIEGPLVPDVAFQPKYWSRFSFYVANYHDQGLIPFKLIHGEQGGVHLTLGLPFFRTSVDHGTAKDIFGRNKANEKSMLKAIKTALVLAKGRFDP